jgi:hypothetical protein
MNGCEKALPSDSTGLLSSHFTGGSDAVEEGTLPIGAYSLNTMLR